AGGGGSASPFGDRLRIRRGLARLGLRGRAGGARAAAAGRTGVVPANLAAAAWGRAPHGRGAAPPPGPAARGGRRPVVGRTAPGLAGRQRLADGARRAGR